MSRFACLAAVLAASACGLSPTEVVGQDDTAQTDQTLAGGCRAVCPKCRPGAICPMYACYLACPSPKGHTCNVRALCALGYEWSEARCSCVPSPGRPGSCSSDADCAAVASYCDGCTCSAQSTSDGAAVCYGTQVSCFADPCLNQTATCVQGVCQLAAL